MSSPIKTVGWDIGGAHLKALLLQHGKVLNALQIPCELWRGLDRLDVAFNQVFEAFEIDENSAQHAVTMTGELVDLFENRQQGVIQISHVVSTLLGKQTFFYASRSGFVPVEGVLAHAGAIASVNWHGSASLLAKYVPNTLFVDIGSTTTDIIPIADGRVNTEAYNDAQRMQSDTLVYAGVVRTPVMALAQKLPFKGAEINVAAEYFATMADVYRLTGDLVAEHDMAETADGKGKSVADSARRLARMIGHDLEDESFETWKNLALTCKNIQMMQIKTAILKHWQVGTPMIGAGAGAFLVAQLARELNCDYMTIPQVLGADLAENVSMCFPAYAVARLLEKC